MADYYVDPVSGNDANSGAVGSPWKTLQGSVKHGFPFTYLQAGDTLWLRGGTYSGTDQYVDLSTRNGSPQSGTSENPITIRAYPNETPVISGRRLGDPCTRGMQFFGLSWWVLDGLTFTDNYCHLQITNGSHWLVKNCTFGHSPVTSDPDELGYAGVYFWAEDFAGEGIYGVGTTQSNIVRNCFFSDWGMVDSTGAYPNDVGVSLSIGNEGGDMQIYYNLVEGCTFIHGCHDHLQLNDAYNVIRDNLFVNEPFFTGGDGHLGLADSREELNPYGAYGNRGTKPGHAGALQQDMRNVFERNRFLYTGPAPDDHSAVGIELGTRRSIYRFNVIAYTLGAGIYFNTSGTTSQSTLNTVYNNTIYKCGLSFVYGGEGMKDFSYGITMSTYEDRRKNNYVVNNIVRQCYGSVDGTGSGVGGNLDPVLAANQYLRNNLSDDSTDPLFVSTAGLGYVYDPNNLPDFRLQAGSPALGAGVYLAFASSSGSGTSLEVDNSLYFSDGNQIVEGDLIRLEGTEQTARVVANDWTNNILTLDTPLTWTSGQGVSLYYSGSAPNIGAYGLTDTEVPPASNSISCDTLSVGTLTVG